MNKARIYFHFNWLHFFVVAMLFTAVAYAQTGKNINQYPVASNLNAGDKFLIWQSGTTKGAPFSLFQTNLFKGITVTGTDIDWSLGTSFYKSLAFNTTLTISNPVEGKPMILSVLTNSWGVNWPSATYLTAMPSGSAVVQYHRINGVTYGIVLTSLTPSIVAYESYSLSGSSSASSSLSAPIKSIKVTMAADVAPYTTALELPLGAPAGSRYSVRMIFPASTNPTLQIQYTFGGTQVLLTRTGTGVAREFFATFVHNGSVWEREFSGDALP